MFSYWFGRTFHSPRAIIVTSQKTKRNTTLWHFTDAAWSVRASCRGLGIAAFRKFQCENASNKNYNSTIHRLPSCDWSLCKSLQTDFVESIDFMERIVKDMCSHGHHQVQRRSTRPWNYRNWSLAHESTSYACKFCQYLPSLFVFPSKLPVLCRSWRVFILFVELDN